jgi:hypothetical protein
MGKTIKQVNTQTNYIYYIKMQKKKIYILKTGYNKKWIVLFT